MRFLDTVKTKLFGEKDGTHGFRAGFVPTILPPLVAAGVVAMGAPVGAGAVVVAAGAAVGGPAVVGAAGAGGFAAYAVAAAAVVVGAGAAVGAAAAVALGAVVVAAVCADAEFAKVNCYNLRRYLAGKGAGCLLSATLAFQTVSGHLPPKQPKAPVAGPVPSTVKSDKGRCGRDFNPAVITDDPLGQKIYTIAAQVNCLSQPNP